MTFQCLETYCCRALGSPTALRSRLVDGWLQVLLDLQRGRARSETYTATLEVVKRHAGAYGMSVVDAQSVISADAAG
jgi:hypothetical protein